VIAPRVVAIGGGHGLAMSLEAMRDLAGHLTAVVSVADDGGSSGRLRRELSIMAPGDMRRCLTALTPPGLVRDAIEHRFEDGVLTGHPAGNLLLAALLENADDPVVAMDTAVAMVGARDEFSRRAGQGSTCWPRPDGARSVARSPCHARATSGVFALHRPTRRFPPRCRPR